MRMSVGAKRLMKEMYLSAAFTTMPLPGRSSCGQRSLLRSIVTTYLGHEPQKIMSILDWSFASDFTDQERRRLKHGVIDYHYDVSGYNFVYASFYVTDTDRHSGAHVMMKRSHIKKPLRMLVGMPKRKKKTYGSNTALKMR